MTDDAMYGLPENVFKTLLNLYDGRYGSGNLSPQQMKELARKIGAHFGAGDAIEVGIEKAADIILDHGWPVDFKKVADRYRNNEKLRECCTMWYSPFASKEESKKEIEDLSYFYDFLMTVTRPKGPEPIVSEEELIRELHMSIFGRFLPEYHHLKDRISVYDIIKKLKVQLPDDLSIEEVFYLVGCARGTFILSGELESLRFINVQIPLMGDPDERQEEIEHLVNKTKTAIVAAGHELPKFGNTDKKKRTQMR